MKNLKLAVRYYFRYLLQLPGRFDDRGKPHILLFTSARSGSTMLMDMIATQPGINFIEQPFCRKWIYNPHAERLPSVPDDELVCLESEDMERIKSYLNGLLSREFMFRSKWNVLSKHYSWSWDRYVVKIHRAKPIIKFLEVSFNADIVYFVRHPIPTSLSAINRGFGSPLMPYLDNDNFVSTWMSNKQFSEAQRIRERGTEFEKRILYWCLENLVPLRLFSQSNWVNISYERLIAEPQATIERMQEQLDLPDADAMVSWIRRPSQTTSEKSRKLIEKEGPSYLADSWTKKVDREDIRKVANILECFEIDLYKPDVAFPKRSFDR